MKEQHGVVIVIHPILKIGERIDLSQLGKRAYDFVIRLAESLEEGMRTLEEQLSPVELVLVDERLARTDQMSRLRRFIDEQWPTPRIVVARTREDLLEDGKPLPCAIAWDAAPD